MQAIVHTLDAAPERRVAAKPVPAHTRVSRSRVAEWVATAGVVAGAAVRMEQFLWRRSLWLDEALVANNIVGRSFAGLLHPLSGEQGAPIGWLWVQRAMVVAFGANEYALRLVPLAAGIIALALIHWLARHVLGPWPAALATWLLALSPQAVRYSVEVKQYSSDLAISLALVVLALQAAEHRVRDGRQDRRAIIGWGWLGAFALWWSHPAVLVIAGTATVLAFDAARRHKEGSGELMVVVRASIPWAVSFGVDWIVSLRRLGHDPFLHTFWKAGFPPSPITPGSAISWLARAPAHLAVDPGGMPLAGIAAGVAALGLVYLVITKPIPGAMVALPLIVAIGAALMGAYPLRGRLALWLIPVLIVGIGAVLRLAQLGGGRYALVAAVGLVVAVAVSPAHQVLDVVRHPETFQDTRPLLQAVRREMRPGDEMWVHAEDNAAVRFYALPTGAVLTDEVEDGPAETCSGNTELRQVGAGHRIWFVYAYHGSDAPGDEETMLVQHLQAAGHLLEVIRRPSADAYLLDFGVAADRPSPPTGDIPCVTVSTADPVHPSGLHTGPFGTGRHV